MSPRAVSTRSRLRRHRIGGEGHQRAEDAALVGGDARMKQTTENPEMAQDSAATETRDFSLDSKGENGPVFDISKAATSPRFRYKSGAPGKLVFERVNEATWKLTGGEQTNVPTSHGQWGGYRTSKAVAWLIDVGETAPAWLARCRDHCCGPSTLREAKAAALAMAKGA